MGSSGYFGFLLVTISIFGTLSLHAEEISQTEISQNEVNPSIQGLDTYSSPQTSSSVTKEANNPYIEKQIPTGFWNNRNNYDSHDYYQHKEYGGNYYNNNGWPFYQHQDYRGSYQGYSQAGGGTPNYYYQYNNQPYYYNNNNNPRASFPYNR